MEKVQSRMPDKAQILNVLSRIKTFLLGKEADQGFIYRVILYLVLIEVAYIYVNPILYMMTTMVKSLNDLIDPTVIWVPKEIYWGHLKTAWNALDYPTSFGISLLLSSVSTLFQVVMCALAGYAFARLNFPLKRTLFVLLIFTFVMPPQLTTLPLIIVYRTFGWIDTYWPMIIPAMFGHGLKGALYIIIYRQFFLGLPKELEEAAKIDGASAFRTFFKVMLPIARPAIIVVALFSFVWNWNDAYYPSAFLFKMEEVPLSMALLNAGLVDGTEQGQLFAESANMAASFLAIMPPLILYLFTQRWFVEGVERTGLVE